MYGISTSKIICGIGCLTLVISVFISEYFSVIDGFVGDVFCLGGFLFTLFFSIMVREDKHSGAVGAFIAVIPFLFYISVRIVYSFN